MVSRQDALLNLSRLLSHAPGLDPEVEGEGLLQPSEPELQQAGFRLAGPLDWHVVVRSTGGDDDFLAEGEVSGTAVIECRRCLSEVETPVETSFIYPMVYRPSQEADLALLEAPVGGDGVGEALEDEEVLAFGRPEVDFAPLLRQLFAIDLPLTVLCREECRGLATDGVNLNDHPDHVPAGEDTATREESPFAKLKDLDVDSRS